LLISARNALTSSLLIEEVPVIALMIFISLIWNTLQRLFLQVFS
jgi:hypothetical protein